MRNKIGFIAIGILTIFVLVLSGCKETSTSTVTSTATPPAQTVNQPANQQTNQQSGQSAGGSVQITPGNSNQPASGNVQQPTVAQSTSAAPAESTSPLQIVTSSFSAGSYYTAYSTTLSATGGKAPYTWSLVSGNLPGGLTLGNSKVLSRTYLQLQELIPLLFRLRTVLRPIKLLHRVFLFPLQSAKSTLLLLHYLIVLPVSLIPSLLA